MARKKHNVSSSRVRNAIAGDLPDVVRVHQIAFKGFFLDRMGPRFLRAYYKAIMRYDAAIFLVNSDDADALDGFAVGFRDPEAFYKHFRSLRLRLLPIIALSLLRRPSLLVEIARNTGRISAAGKGNTSVVELSSIATSRLGTGVGSKLLLAFCDQSRRLGASEVTLTTDRDDNAPVVDFYLRHGFEKRGTELRGARVLEVMTCDLSINK
ncbi:GNAT family N-acetyltransferase [Altererythrobacter aquiaggeris]|uniref:GNAT family N-acetyltransferase n=1 Tax=Aestuarierythrobacter aquiaggeris TaxID=1898396 RepID=UPI0030187E7C